MPRIFGVFICILALFVVSAIKSAPYDETVYQAQKILKENGYNPGTPDGQRGKKTEEVLKKLQQDKRFSVSGQLDEKTKEALGIKTISNRKDVKNNDIVTLIGGKKVEVKTQGSGIQNVNLEVRRLVDSEINVLIPVGTFFVSRNPSAQNMVTTQEKTVILRDNAWVSVNVSAACANRPRATPGDQDSFRIQRSPQRKELEKLMPVLQNAHVGSAVQQAAVWIVTDNADYDDLGVLVRRSQYQVFGGDRIINEYEAAMAMKICDDAGINITKNAIWKDRNTIVKGLKDESLKKWFDQKTR